MCIYRYNASNLKIVLLRNAHTFIHTYTHALKQFAAFIVGDSCDGINKLLEKFLDSQLDGDDLCFDVVAVLLGVSVFIYTYMHT